MHLKFRHSRAFSAIGLLAILYWVGFAGMLVYNVKEIVPTANAQTTDLALFKTITASSVQSATYPPALAVDGKADTRWSSAYADNQFLVLDLGFNYVLSNLGIDWEAAYATDFDVQTSLNGTDWTTTSSIRGNKSLTSVITGFPPQARYIKLLLIKRATSYGFSIFNLTASGFLPVTLPPEPVVYKFQTPICYAKDDEERREYSILPPRLVVAWYCDRPGGIQGYVRVFSFKSVVPALAVAIAYASTTEQKAKLDAYLSIRDLDADEQLVADAFTARVRPTAKVAPITTNKRPIYTANPDRTLGPKTGLSIAVGEACLINDRLVTLNPDKTVAGGTNYFAVPGGFALCTLTGAITK